MEQVATEITLMVLMELTAKWVVDSLSSFRSFIHSTHSGHPDSLLFSFSLFSFRETITVVVTTLATHLLGQTLPTWVSLVPSILIGMPSSTCSLLILSDFPPSFPLLIVLYSSLSALVSLFSSSASRWVIQSMSNWALSSSTHSSPFVFSFQSLTFSPLPIHFQLKL